VTFGLKMCHLATLLPCNCLNIVNSVKWTRSTTYVHR
jgi:hypothetical protein